MNLLVQLVVQLFQLISLRRKPHDIAYVREAALITFFTYVATSYFQMVASQLPVNALYFSLAQALIQAGLYFIILKLSNKDKRFIQMATAIFGVSSILQFASLILSSIGPFAIIGAMASGWNIALLIIILKETLECRLGVAIVLTIVYHFIIGVALFALFPEFFAFIQQQMVETPA